MKSFLQFLNESKESVIKDISLKHIKITQDYTEKGEPDSKLVHAYRTKQPVPPIHVIDRKTLPKGRAGDYYRKMGKQPYFVFDGNNRVKAAKHLGLSTIKARIWSHKDWKNRDISKDDQ